MNGWHLNVISEQNIAYMITRLYTVNDWNYEMSFLLSHTLGTMTAISKATGQPGFNIQQGHWVFYFHTGLWYSVYSMDTEGNVSMNLLSSGTKI